MSVYTHDGGHGPLVVGDALHGVIDAEIEVEDARLDGVGHLDEGGIDEHQRQSVDIGALQQFRLVNHIPAIVRRDCRRRGRGLVTGSFWPLAS